MAMPLASLKTKANFLFIVTNKTAIFCWASETPRHQAEPRSQFSRNKIKETLRQHDVGPRTATFQQADRANDPQLGSFRGGEA